MLFLLPEKIYRVGFYVVKFFRSRKREKLPFKVISVGNISTGGVGKSVFVRFLIENLNGSGAIFLRGYKGENERTGKSFLVSDGKEQFCKPSFCGDEAFMFSKMLSVPIVVGKNRVVSGKLLEQFCVREKKQIDYVVLDDAYQNYGVKKDFEVLLLDARTPFGNGHCLPAGPLREKDTSRADVIVLTHVDSVDNIEDLKESLNGKVFCGRHKASGILDVNFKEVSLGQNDKLLAFAGIGSFTGFLETITSAGLCASKTIEYEDHHKYTNKNLFHISGMIKRNGLHGAITTRKDLHKVVLLLEKFAQNATFPLYCLDVKFEFLTQEEKESFLALV